MMDAIFKREWRSYFLSPTGYIFAGVFLALCSFFFVNGALMYQRADIMVVFSNINILYLFLISMLTMGLFSAERSRRTDQLLLTSPVSVGKIVVAKYCAALWVFEITLLLSLVYPLIFCMFGAPPMSEILGAYIGVLLLWGAFIAIGTMISSLTESQVIAAIVTFGVLLVIFYMNTLSATISNPILETIVRWLSLMDRYAEFQSGVLNLVHVVYYLSVIGLFLFLTVQIIRRRQVSDTRIRIGNLIVTVTVVAGVILCNGIVSVIGSKIPLKVDLTGGGVYQYSGQTLQVLENIEDDVFMYALYPDGAEGELVVTVKEYLSQYAQKNPHIKVVYKNPYEDPAFVRNYGEDVSVGSVVVEQGERFRVIPLEQQYNENPYSGSVSVDIEKQFTSAIQYVTGKSKPVKVCFVKGHQEYAGMDSFLAEELNIEGYTVEELTIATDGIPKDTDLLIFLAPTVDITHEELEALDAYLLGGGQTAFVFTAGNHPMERLQSFLAEWGVVVNNDFVIENDASMAYQSQSGVPVPAPRMLEHAITQKLIQREIAMITPASCSLSLEESNPQYAKVTPLLQTSKNSWGETDLSSETLKKSEEEEGGPLTLAAIAQKQEGGKIFVFGSLQAIETQGLLADSSYANGDFVMNALSYLTDKGDALHIRPKVISAEKLSMTEQQVRVTAVLVQYVFPFLILLIGLVVWLRRRYL